VRNVFAVELSCSGCRAGNRDVSCARAWWLTEPDAAERRHFVTRWEAHVAGQQEVLNGSTHAHSWRYDVVEVAASRS
jgi:hypothetical protein